MATVVVQNPKEKINADVFLMHPLTRGWIEDRLGIPLLESLDPGYQGESDE